MYQSLNNVHFLEGLPIFQDIISAEKYSQIIILVDENTKAHCYPKVKSLLPQHQIIEIKSGEIHKNLETCQQIWQKLTDFETDRKTLMLNLGGGVIGDMGGFCASTYKRGIDFIQIPTTLLAQVDASVGGKLGIDFQDLKNHIGLFREPNQVIIYPNFLETLPQREFFSGLAEIIKHALIADKEYWQELVNLNQKSNSKEEFYTSLNKNLMGVIQKSVQIKENVVSQDLKEGGLRKILNFGHTIGHAIESFYLKTENSLLHGEAIAIGMICESFLSYKKDYITKEELDEIIIFILNIYSKVNIEDNETSDIIKLTTQDKKNESGKVKLSLLEKLGKGNFNQEVPQNWIKESLEYYISMKF